LNPFAGSTVNRVHRKDAMITKTLLVLLVGFGTSAVAIRAGCKSDCRDEYESEVESCKLLHDDPDDADDLQLCIQIAKDDYESCIEECDN